MRNRFNYQGSAYRPARIGHQLRILAQLRKLAPETLTIMDSIAKYVSEENDILYRRGEIKGLEKGIQKGL
jgi:hypothetical protein